jgi:hypothetical protein
MGLDAGFLAMLTMRMTWEPHTGRDTWGNETYGVPVPNTPCFVSSQAYDFGGQDNHHKAEGDSVLRVEVIADAIGVKIKDRLTLPGNRVVYVTGVDTPQDEQGNDLMHTIRAETAQKG